MLCFKMSNLSVILCTYNESENIANALNQLVKNKDVDQIIIVDDNSSDGTIEIIKSFKNDKIKYFIRENAKNFASAFIFGIKMSDGNYVMRFDLDMYEDIDFFVKEFKKNQSNDCIIFSRYVFKGADQRSNFRKVTSIIINKLCQLILSSKVKDYTSCIMVFKRSILKNNTLRNTGYANFVIEFIFRLILQEKKILEVPYIQKKKTELNSKTASNFFVFMKNGFYYLATIIKCFFIKF